MLKVFNIFKKLYWFMCTQLGIDFKKTLRAFLGFSRYVKDLFRFCYNYRGRVELLPCLHDWNEENGEIKNEYFWQDLLVAKKIFEANPDKHVDVGSRVDGFIGHVASFREIEVFDIRQIAMQIPGVIYRQVDITEPIIGMTCYCDSISCLHALEHFGLGRYGDSINPKGFQLGFENMARLLKKGGTFYLSVPVGAKRVEFNANWVFDPRVIIELGVENSLSLYSLTLIYPSGKIEVFLLEKDKLFDLASQRYVLAIFVFIKL